MIDAKTVFLIAILSDVLFCMCGLILWRSQPQVKGMFALAMTFASRGAGLTALVTAPMLVPFIGIWGGNVLLVLSGICLLEGFSRFLGQSPPRMTQVTLLMTAFVSWPLLLTFRPDDVTIRIALLATIGAICYARCGILFLQDRTQPASLRRIMIAWSVITAAACTSWAVAVWFDPPRNLFDPHPLQEMYLLFHLLSFLVKGVMTAILVGVRLRGELLARVEDERSQMLMLSHELRTPLAIMLRSSEMLEESHSHPDPSGARRIGQIRLAAARMSALVEQFLVHAQEAQSRERKERFDLAAEIRALSHSPRIRLDLPRRVDFVGDKNTISIIFSNLVDNALKYSPADTEVDVLLRAEDRMILLCVQDRGPGFGDEEDRPRLGEKFFRASHTQEVPGIGLGIYTVRKLVSLLEGSLLLAPREGGGAVATVTIPWNSR